MQKNEADVDGIELIQIQMLWFVIAGFVLGFTTSTLWEWLYYRRKRLQRLAFYEDPRFHTHSSANSQQNSITSEPPQRDASSPPTDDWSLPTYRSSGVLLENEMTTTPSVAEQPPSSENGVATQRIVIESPAANVETKPIATSSSSSAHPLYNNMDGSSASNQSASSQPDNSTLSDEQLAPSSSTIEQNHSDVVGVTAQYDERARKAAAAVRQTMEQQLAEEELEDSGAGIATVARNSPPSEVLRTPITPVVTPNSPVPNPSDRAQDYPDNLAMIRGIGEAYKQRLYATQIYTWRQLAESDTESLRRITRAKPNADIESWQTQARELAMNYQRWDANFPGPLDNFTQIEGIGAITADLLYKAGICTFAHLAAAEPDELARIVPAPTVGDENDFDGWIANAARLANIQRRNQELRL